MGSRNLFIIGTSIGILLCLVSFQYIYMAQKSKEGFSNPKNKENIQIVRPDSANDSSKVPKPEGTSVIPNTVPGATDSNPTKSLASIKDIKELIEIIKTYNSVYEINAESASQNTEYAYLSSNSINYQKSLQTQIDSGIISDKYKFIKDLRERYVKATRVLRQNVTGENRTPLTETKSKSSSKVLEIGDLENTIERAKKEKADIDNMRSPSSDIKQRAVNLDKVIQDLQDYISKIKRGTMKIEDIPISKKELNTFLDNKNGNLNISTKKNKSRSKYLTSSMIKKNTEEKFIKYLSKAVNDLSWEIKLGYDPKVTLHRKTMERLEKINKEIKSGKLTKEVLESKILELQVLKQQCETNNRRNLSSTDNVILANNNNVENYETLEKIEGYSAQIDKAYQPLIRTVKQASDSNDWRSRPGYEPTNEIISQRAKASSFDYDTVSSVDYFKRSQFLCNQIRDAELGDPADFGCIANKDDVSPEYSWRGNYKMVCSRLGNTWGGWYPEMFGCPKSEVSTSMVPNKKIDI